jgi:glycosyltransferase involved in cell wall biosynthesis
MKIVHLIWAFPIGGAETMLVEIMNIQCVKNAVVLFIINDLVNEGLISKIDKRVKVIKINRPVSTKNFFFYFKIWYFLKKERAAIFHCHNANLIRLLNGNKKKSFVTIHSVDFDSYYLQDYNKIFAISKIVKDEVLDKTGIESILIYNGIKVADIVKKESYSDEIFKIVQISRLEHGNKGQDILIKALDYILKNSNIKNIQLDFIGKGSSKPFLKNMVKDLELNSSVNFLGEIDKSKVYKIIVDYNLLVQPSRFEGFGLTIVEAMAAKLPLLVSNVGGPIEIIEYGKYGSYFNSENYIECGNKIISIIRNYEFYTNNARLEKIREYAIDKFDVNKTASKYLTEYRG